MVGAVVILGGIVCQVVQLVVSIRARDKLRRDRRSMEWPHARMGDGVAAAGLEFRLRAATSPDIDAFWTSKRRAQAKQDKPRPAREYEPIEMPKNSATGFVSAFFAVVIGFAMIWHIWWMAGRGSVRRIRDAACLRIPQTQTKSRCQPSRLPGSSGPTRQELQYEHRRRNR